MRTSPSNAGMAPLDWAHTFAWLDHFSLGLAMGPGACWKCQAKVGIVGSSSGQVGKSDQKLRLQQDTQGRSKNAFAYQTFDLFAYCSSHLPASLLCLAASV